MIRKKTWRGIVILAAIAVGTWMLANDSRKPKSEPLADLDTRLDYALWNFNAQMLDADGVVNLEIDAPILRNNANTRIGSVEIPRIRILLDFVLTAPIATPEGIPGGDSTILFNSWSSAEGPDRPKVS